MDRRIYSPTYHPQLNIDVNTPRCVGNAVSAINSGVVTINHALTPPTKNLPSTNIATPLSPPLPPPPPPAIAPLCNPTPNTKNPYPTHTPALRPNRLPTHAATGYWTMAPSADTALTKPSHAPVGRRMNAFHCGSACSPFISDPS